MDKETRETIRILKRARKLISRPERWTKGFYACNADLVSVEIGSSQAVCFCSAGAIERAAGDLGVGSSVVARLALAHGLKSGGLFRWNDHPSRTHASVLARFDRTIARLEKSR